jgi:hypothetical protein
MDWSLSAAERMTHAFEIAEPQKGLIREHNIDG